MIEQLKILIASMEAERDAVNGLANAINEGNNLMIDLWTKRHETAEKALNDAVKTAKEFLILNEEQTKISVN